MNIKLNILIAAAAQMKLMLEIAEHVMSNDEYRKAMGAYCDLHAEVAHLTKQIKVEVEA